MTTRTVEKWAWILIYGGLLLLSLGVFVLRGDADLGWTLAVVGAVTAVAGAVLIAVRARMHPANDDKQQELP
jgi:hypothetical protein